MSTEFATVVEHSSRVDLAGLAQEFGLTMLRRDGGETILKNNSVLFIIGFSDEEECWIRTMIRKPDECTYSTDEQEKYCRWEELSGVMRDFIRSAQKLLGDQYNLPPLQSDSTNLLAVVCGDTRARIGLKVCQYNGGLGRGGHASVVLTDTDHGDLELLGQGEGNGAIDAIKTACEAAMEENGFSIPRPKFAIQVKGDGSDASAAVSVQFQEGGGEISGTAENSDVVLACVFAYIDAVNRLLVSRESVRKGE